MMGSPHILVGAALGATLRRPWLAYPVAFGSHILLDMVPHHDSHDILVPVGGNHVAEGAIAVLDFALAWAVVIWLARGQPWRRVAVWSGFFAIVIDLVFNLPLWGPVLKAWPPTAGIGAWHLAIQPHLPPGEWLRGFGPQVLVLVIGVWVLRRARGPAKVEGVAPASETATGYR